MKSFFLFLTLGTSLTATAQQQSLVQKQEYPIKGAAVTITDTTGERFRQLPGRMVQRGLIPQAVFSHNTSRGKIYTLPIDNMPCLVPDMNQVSRMPGVMPPADNRMPNAIPQQPIIPRDKKEEKKD